MDKEERGRVASIRSLLGIGQDRFHCTAVAFLLEQLDAAQAEANRLRSGVLHLAAEAHRRKWAHDAGEDRDGNPVSAPAFTELHRIGDELRRLLNAAPKPAVCPRCKGSGIDPEDSHPGSVTPGEEEPPALEPCRDCQFPAAPLGGTVLGARADASDRVPVYISPGCVFPAAPQDGCPEHPGGCEADDHVEPPTVDGRVI